MIPQVYHTVCHFQDWRSKSKETKKQNEAPTPYSHNRIITYAFLGFEEALTGRV